MSSVFYLLPLAGYWALLIYQLGAQWSAYEQYNYGWAVPFLCGYLLWQRFRPSSSTPRLQSPACDTGIRRSDFVAYLLFALLAALWFVARWLHEASPIWRLTSWALALEVLGITFLTIRLAGDQWSVISHQSSVAGDQSSVTRVSAFQRFSISAFAFPICFFLVAVPWPTGFEILMTQSFMRANVSVTTELLGFAGIPALQRGNVIEIGTGLVGVDEACSGIRSFQATLMISLFLGELYRLSALRRVAFCLAGFALAFLFNIGRTFLLVYVASRDGIAAMGKWHDPAGATILVGCFLGLWVIGLWLARGPRTVDGVLVGQWGGGAVDGNPKPEDSSQPPEAGNAAFNLPLSAFRFFRRPHASALGPRRSTSPGFRRLAFALAAWFVFTEVAVEGWYRYHEVRASAAQGWALRWPTEDPTFKRIELSESVKAQLSFDEGGQGAWSAWDGSFWQVFYFRWQPSRALYARVRSQLNKAHRPENCLTGSGMKQVGDLGVGHYRCGDVQFSLNRLLFESDGRLLRVFYAQYEDSAKPDLLANYRENTQQRIASAWAGSRNYGLRILELAVAGNLDESQADAAVQRQLERLILVPPARKP